MGIRLVPRSTIGSFTILEHVSKGGEGDVYKAVSISGETVALKQLNFSASEPRNKESLERALRLKRLIGMRSPCVCEVYDVFIHDDLVYIVMEWVTGQSLEKTLATRGPLTLDWLVPAMRDVLAGLGWLHELDIVHRDVKPGNVIVSEAKTAIRAILVDLGVLLDRGLPRVTCKGGFVGTPVYVAPEMILGVEGEVDARTDLYCVGATLFELLTGYLPFPEPGHPIRRTFVEHLIAPKRPSVRDYVEAIPESVDRYIQRLMSVSPDDRPSTAAAAWEELQVAVEESGGVMPPADSPVRGPITKSHTALPNLIIQSGPLTGTAISIPKNGLTLGRAALNPEDSRISRFHIRVRPTKRGLVVRDQRSLNGLIHRGRRLRRVVLPPGESLLVGETRVRFSE
ncbi:MAG: protein kinase [Candidatus Hydrogenedentes bacterium]|nr:protein kinase [Candidatus Hydrogenedentota bacterium]